METFKEINWKEVAGMLKEGAITFLELLILEVCMIGGLVLFFYAIQLFIN